jgi:hypothetical protein
VLLFGVVISFLALVGVFFCSNLIFKNILIFLFGMAIAGNFTITFSISTGLFPKYNNSTSGFLVAYSNLGIIVFQYL